jgi:hypothetical protein
LFSLFSNGSQRLSATPRDTVATWNAICHLRSADFQGAINLRGLAMTIHRIRPLTECESEELIRQQAHGFDELENQVCELRLMAKLAREQGDPELRDFALIKLCEMAEALWKGYYEVCIQE